MSTAKFWCQNALFRIAWPNGMDANFIRCHYALENGDVGCKTGMPWNLMCTRASLANKRTTNMLLVLPDLWALMPTSSDVVLLSKWWCRPQNGGIRDSAHNFFNQWHRTVSWIMENPYSWEGYMKHREKFVGGVPKIPPSDSPGTWYAHVQPCKYRWLKTCSGLHWCHLLASSMCTDTVRHEDPAAPRPPNKRSPHSIPGHSRLEAQLCFPGLVGFHQCSWSGPTGSVPPPFHSVRLPRCLVSDARQHHSRGRWQTVQPHFRQFSSPSVPPPPSQTWWTLRYSWSFTQFSAPRQDISSKWQ